MITNFKGAFKPGTSFDEMMDWLDNHIIEWLEKRGFGVIAGFDHESGFEGDIVFLPDVNRDVTKNELWELRDEIIAINERFAEHKIVSFVSFFDEVSLHELEQRIISTTSDFGDYPFNEGDPLNGGYF